MAGEERTRTNLTVDCQAFVESVQNALKQAMLSVKPDERLLLRVVVPGVVPVEWLIGLTDGEKGNACEYFWGVSDEQLYLAGFGCVSEIVASGRNRFDAIETQMKELHSREEAEDLHYALPPVWVGGYSFDSERRGLPWKNWPDARFILPRWQFQAGRKQVVAFQAVVTTKTDKEAIVKAALQELREWLDISSPAGPGGQQEREQRDKGFAMSGDRNLSYHGSLTRQESVATDFESWQDAVTSTAGDIRNHLYRKAVLARCQVSRVPPGFRIGSALKHLASAYPESVIFSFRNGDEIFLGASPERLVDVMNGKVHVDCLAGSIRRGENSVEDERLGEELLHSAKDLLEHQVVVDSVLSAVEGAVTDVSAPAKPRLRKLANVQHLYTPVEGRLVKGSVLRLVRLLHPTPAVAGQPREMALAVIRARETVARGWYAGAFGMVAENGDGHFLVALRSGLLACGQLYLFAGAGIMGESDARMEWRETQWKMQPMLSVLQQYGIVTGGRSRE